MIFYKNNSKRVKIEKDASISVVYYDFIQKTIQKRVKIEKVASIFFVQYDFLQKQFKNGSKLKRLIRFAWSSSISYKNHSETGQNCKFFFDFCALVGFHTKTIQKRDKIERLLRFERSSGALWQGSSTEN